jgi:DMSO/TMAO reductase YedYZ molybdopterin-dependent catalytic subunit
VREPNKILRRQTLGLISATGASLLTGCDKLNEAIWFTSVLASAEGINRHLHQAAGRGTSLAQEFTLADVSPSFRGNGTIEPDSAFYQAQAKTSFADWPLLVDGLVEAPTTFSMAQLRAMPARTQITRHDCVEGWSAIGQWTGVNLSTVLALVRPSAQARFALFHCADTFGGHGGKQDPYYESIDLLDAYHPQTILAYRLNGKTLPIANGAPLRLRVERQLGYKQAKYITRIELVSNFSRFGQGNGGYWEDRGYQWYAGI